MLLAVRLDVHAMRRWHTELLDRISALPRWTVVVEAGPKQPVVPGIAWLFRLEALVHGLEPAGLASPAEPSAMDRYSRRGEDKPDLCLDLGSDKSATGGRIWILAFDGVPGEAGLLGAVLAGRSPVAELMEGTRIVASGRLGTESHGVKLATFEDALARITTLIIGALSGAAPRLPPDELPSDAANGNLPAIALGRTVFRALARHGLRSVHRMVYRTPHWRVGWRTFEGSDLFDLRAHPDAGWHDLPDDGTRFYADPFPIDYRGSVWLFVEDFPHRTGRGLISVVRFDRDGPVGRPEPVLDLPYHLSYPFVFERDGDVWMVPESCATGTIDLFRATKFPGGWVKVATLVEGVIASDATLYERDGRWWLFATVKDGGSYSDALHLWSAPDFRGPWTPHAQNPVLIDSASARPAGRIVERGGSLFRPVQDCRTGYGAALGLARITQLDDQRYSQTVETILRAGPRWPGRRLHTLNRAGAFEFIDGSGVAPRFWSNRRR